MVFRARFGGLRDDDETQEWDECSDETDLDHALPACSVGARDLPRRAGAGVLAAADWPGVRGPARDGRSTETGLPEKWSPPGAGGAGRAKSSGENLAWRAPYGGRSGPIVVGNRVYLQNLVGDEKTTQERLMCLDADTGKPIWERKFSIFLSDVPQHRAGWASPAADPETGNIYVFTVGAELIARVARGKGALVAVARRGLRRDHHARRTHRVAHHRWRERDREHAQLRMGRPGADQQPVLRVRQAHGAVGLDQHAAEAALRHELRDARDRGGQRHAAAHRRRHRRRHPRDDGRHRRAGVAVGRQQARDQQQRA